MTPKVRVRIAKTEMVGNNYNFTVKISDENSNVLGFIEGKDEL